jgi:hypothetical protein
VLDTLEIVLDRRFQIPMGEQGFGVGQQRTGLDDLGSVAASGRLRILTPISLLTCRHHRSMTKLTLPQCFAVPGFVKQRRWHRFSSS